MLKTPVIFMIFNRPELTKKVFKAIRQAQPQKLFVVADGARFPEEEEKCQQTRSIINNIDWDCEVLTNFSEKNLGCKNRVASGLDWAFSQVEEAIILEDDCLPAPSFFNFCQTLLEKYRDDERVMHIGGTNLQLGQSRTQYSYYFSKYTHIWGWATWRRAWRHYDVEIKTWSEYKKLGVFDSLFGDYYEQNYWTNIFEEVFDGAINTWDYQWLYTCWSQNGLSIIPDCNMISNLGFGIDATHTFSKNDSKAKLPVFDIWDIQHPPFIVHNYQADLYTFDCAFNGNTIKNNYRDRTIIRRSINKIGRIFKPIYSFY